MQPLAFTLLLLLIMSCMISSNAVDLPLRTQPVGARSTLLRQRNPSDRETRAITALTEPVIADHTLYEYNIKNSTVHDNATDYTEYGFTAAGKSFDIEAERTQTKHLDDHAKDGTAPPCDEILEGHVMSRSMRTFHCKNAASFSKWEVEVSLTFYLLFE